MERLQGVEGVRPTAFSTAYTYHKMKSTVQEFVSEVMHSRARILDVGCGRGYDLLRLAEQYDSLDIQLYGVEVVREDLLLASHRAKSITSPAAKGFMLAIGERMPFRSGSFDAVICSEVVEHLPNPDLTLSEIARVLRFGGVLALTTPNPGNKLHKLRRLLPRGLKVKADDWRKLQLTIDDERRKAGGVNLPHISEHSSDQWCQKLRSAGLEVKETRRGSLLYGDPYLEEHPVLWACSLILDKFLDHVSNDWSWQVLIKAKKEGQVDE